MHRDCRRAYFSGTVQGVGFRYTTRRLARDLDVDGFVRNLPDGRVELVAEGDPAEIVRFFRAVQEAMNAYIQNMTTEPCSPPETPFDGFTIR